MTEQPERGASAPPDFARPAFIETVPGRVGSATRPPRTKPEPPPERGRSPRLARAAAAVFAAVCVAGGVDTARRAAADRLIASADPRGLDAALALDPWNPVARLKAAFVAEDRAGDPAAALADLRRALDLHPAGVRVRLAMAERLEAAGEPEEAERALLAAAELDGGFRPLWALANFAWRHGRENDFWRWARAAAESDATAADQIFDLSWRVFDDATRIQERGVGDLPETKRRYFSYLVDRGRFPAAHAFWPAARPHLSPVELPAARRHLEHLLEQGAVERALTVWNDLADQRLIAAERLSIERGELLTNPALQRQPLGFGFDWRMPLVPGAGRALQPGELGARVLTVSLTGNQPSPSTFLWQYAPVQPGGRYLFRFQYLTQNLSDSTGLRWRVRDHSGNRLIADGGSLPAPLAGGQSVWRDAELRFTVPPDVELARIEFAFEIERGVAWQLGVAAVRRLDLAPAPSAEEGQ